jgi:hypothetical protein
VRERVKELCKTIREYKKMENYTQKNRRRRRSLKIKDEHFQNGEADKKNV